MKQLAHHVWRKTRVVSLNSNGPAYCERHRVSGWALLPLGLLGVATMWAYTADQTDSRDPLPVITAGAACVLLIGAAFLRVVISVDRTEFAYRIWPFYGKQVPLRDIRVVNEFTVPERWYEMPRAGRWYVPAVHGVRICLNSGGEVSVSTEHAHLLANAIDAARHQEQLV